MAEIRKVRISEMKDVMGYTPDIPTNWYVPAYQAWTYFAWCLLQIRKGKTFRNDKDMNHCMDKFEEWIEDYAIAYGKGTEDEEDDNKEIGLS